MTIISSRATQLGIISLCQDSLCRFYLTVVGRISIGFAIRYVRNLLAACIDSRRQYTWAICNGQTICIQCAVAGCHSVRSHSSCRYRTGSQATVCAQVDVLIEFHCQRAAAIGNDADVAISQLAGICRAALDVELIVQFQRRVVPCITTELQAVVGGGYGLVVDEKACRSSPVHISSRSGAAGTKGNTIRAGGIFQFECAAVGCIRPIQLDGFFITISTAGT